MVAQPEHNPIVTEAEYLAFERASEFKHELIDGQIVAMSGASRAHNLIVASLLAALLPQLRGRGCEIYPSDLKVRLPQATTYAYPDVTIMCGAAQFNDDQNDVLLNPTVIIEVLSPSTEAYDRGDKFKRYRELDSLQEYILVSQHTAQIDRFSKQTSSDWLLNDASGMEAILHLTAIDCRLPLAEVYEQVDFESGADGTYDKDGE